MSSTLPVTPFNGPADFIDEPYRDDYRDRYSSQGGSFDDYLPAYRYGHELGNDPTYAGRDWDSAEDDLRTAWEAKHADSPWQHFKDAVRHAWERVKS